MAVQRRREHLSRGHVGVWCGCHQAVASALFSEATWGGKLESLALILASSKSHVLGDPHFSHLYTRRDYTVWLSRVIRKHNTESVVEKGLVNIRWIWVPLGRVRTEAQTSFQERQMGVWGKPDSFF